MHRILLFYMEEYSIKDIAKACKCNENTVKSRLNYGKQKLEEKTLELQQKGYVLWGVSPVYLITWLLRSDMANKLKFVYSNTQTLEYMNSIFYSLVNAGIIESTTGISTITGGVSDGVSSGMINGGITNGSGYGTINGGIAKGTAASVVKGGVTKGSAAAIKGGIHTVAGKIAAGAVAAAITGGLITTGVVINNNNKNDNEIVAEVTEDASEEVSTTEVTTTEEVTEAATTEVASEEDLVSDTLVTGDVEDNPNAYYEEMYSEVIETYIYLIDEWRPNFNNDDNDDWAFDEEFIAEHPWATDNNYDIATIIWELNPEKEYIGYWIYDIDGNDIPELIIGSCNDNLIYGLFTITDDEITLICYSIIRGRYYYAGDNKLVCMVSGNWATVYYELLEYNSDNLNFVEAIFTTAKDQNDTDAGILYGFTTDSDCDYFTNDSFNSSNTSEISESEYNSKKAEYINESYTFPDLTPLSEY